MKSHLHLPFFEKFSRLKASEFDIPVFFHTPVDKNWRIGPRHIEENLFYLITSGRVEARIEGKLHEMKAQRLIVIAAGTLHDLCIPEDMHGAGMYIFRLRVPKRIKWNEGITIFGENPHYALFMERIFSELNSTQAYRQEELRSLIAALGFLACRSLLQEPFNKSGGLNITQHQAVMNYFNDHCQRPLKPAELAKAASLSEDYFARQFQISFSVSPRTWIKRERVYRVSHQMMESTQTLSQLSEAWGYPDLYYFSKHFKDVMGVSPQKYREGRR